MGTADYLAPEQARDAASADARADLYGLGGTLFFLLTGRAPFEHRRGLDDKLHAHRKETAADVRSLRPEVPAALAALVRQLLAKDADERPRTAAEVAAALASFAAPAFSNHSVPTETILPAPARGPGRVVWAVAGLLLAGLAGLGVWAWWGRPGPVPLTVRNLKVFRLSADEGLNARQLGELGARPPEGAYWTRLNERVRFEVELSEPAYAYLLGFNPTDKVEEQEQIIPRSEAGLPPGKRTALAPGKWLRLSDGQGLQAYAVVASRRPLPPYADWLRTRPPLPWKHTKGHSKNDFQGFPYNVLRPWRRDFSEDRSWPTARSTPADALLPKQAGPPRPLAPPPDQPPHEPTQRAAAPLAGGPGVQEGRLRRRHPLGPDQRTARRYHPPRTRGTRRRTARPTHRPHPQARRRPQAGKKK